MQAGPHSHAQKFTDFAEIFLGENRRALGWSLAEDGSALPLRDLSESRGFINYITYQIQTL